MLGKEELRKLVNQIISKKTPQEIAEESSEIRKNIQSIIETTPLSWTPRVLAYFPLNDEVNITELLISWDLCLPGMVKNRIKPFIIKDLTTNLITSEKWGVTQGGIKEPSGDCEEAPRKSIDFVIIPGRAFDKKGNRIGRGKGHYDRFLLTVPRAIKIGVCFHNQLFGSVPTEEHDIQLDYIVTNKGIYGPKATEGLLP